MIGLTLADLGLVSEKRENERATIGAAFALFYRNRTGRSPDTHEAWLIARLADALAGADVHMRDSTRRMLNAKYEYQRQALRHGDVATNADLQTFRHRITQWCEQYEAIRQRPWRPSSTREPRTLLGGPPRPALTHFLRAALNPAPSVSGVVEPSLGRSLDLGDWFLGPLGRPADPLVAGLTDLARAEFRAGRWAAAAAVARLARARAPDEVAPQRLLAHASSWSVEGEPPADQHAATHAALGARTGSSGTTSARSSNTGPPLALDGNLPAVHSSLSRIRMPGDDYHVWLDCLHEVLRPETYVEIGVATGTTLALVRPPTGTGGSEIAALDTV